MATIQPGINIFHYNGSTLTLADQTWKNELRAIYKANPTRNGWVSYKPSSGFPALTQLVDNEHYFVDAINAFELPGANQVVDFVALVFDDVPTEGSANPPTSGSVYTSLAGKVDKIAGKQLSTEDYTSAEKTKLGALPTNADLTTALGNKVENNTYLQFLDQNTLELQDIRQQINSLDNEAPATPAGFVWVSKPDLYVYKDGSGNWHIGADTQAEFTLNGTPYVIANNPDIFGNIALPVSPNRRIDYTVIQIVGGVASYLRVAGTPSENPLPPTIGSQVYYVTWTMWNAIGGAATGTEALEQEIELLKQNKVNNEQSPTLWVWLGLATSAVKMTVTAWLNFLTAKVKLLEERMNSESQKFVVFQYVQSNGVGTVNYSWNLRFIAKKTDGSGQMYVCYLDTANVMRAIYINPRNPNNQADSNHGYNQAFQIPFFRTASSNGIIRSRNEIWASASVAGEIRMVNINTFNPTNFSTGTTLNFDYANIIEDVANNCAWIGGTNTPTVLCIDLTTLAVRYNITLAGNLFGWALCASSNRLVCLHSNAGLNYAIINTATGVQVKTNSTLQSRGIYANVQPYFITPPRCMNGRFTFRSDNATWAISDALITDDLPLAANWIKFDKHFSTALSPIYNGKFYITRAVGSGDLFAYDDAGVQIENITTGWLGYTNANGETLGYDHDMNMVFGFSPNILQIGKLKDIPVES